METLAELVNANRQPGERVYDSDNDHIQYVFSSIHIVDIP